MRRMLRMAALVIGVVGWVGSSGAAPTVTSFSPQLGAAGTQVTVEGSGFSEATKVQFNDIAADFQVSSSTRLTTTVPVEATYGPIRISSGGVTGDSGTRYFLPSPRIDAIRPTRGAEDTTVVLEGINFAQVIEVRFGDGVAVFSEVAPAQLACELGIGAVGATADRDEGIAL